MVKTQKSFKIMSFILIFALMFASLMIATNKSKPVHAAPAMSKYSSGLYQSGTYFGEYGLESDFKVLVKSLEQLISDGDLTSPDGYCISSINNKNLEGDLVIKVNNGTNLNLMLEGCTKLTTVVIEANDIGYFNNLNRMFYGCTSLKSVCLDNFVIDINANVGDMFTGCKNLSEIQIYKANHTFKELGLIFESYTQGDTSYTEESVIPEGIRTEFIKLSGYKGQTVAQTGIVTDMLGITMLAVMILVLAYFLTRKKVNKG